MVRSIYMLSIIGVGVDDEIINGEPAGCSGRR